MASNPLGPLTKNLSANVLTETYVAVHKLAGKSGLSVSQYVRALLESAVEKETLVRENPLDKSAFYQAVLASAPVPKVRLEVVPQNELDFPEEQSARVAEPPAEYKAGKKKA